MHRPFELKDWSSLLILLALCGVLFFSGLGFRSLWESDESRYAEIAREMVESGDWLTPRLNYVKYFEKPALSYWLIALSFKAFGMSEYTARLTPAVFATLTVLLTFWLGRSLWGTQSGFWGALCLATCLMFLVLSQIILVDMVLCFGLVLSLCGAWHVRSGHGWGRWLFWGGAAVGFMTKGLMGVGLPVLAVLAFALPCREWNFIKNLARPKGIILFLLLTLPWIIWVSLVNPEFFSFFFWEQNWERLVTTKHQRYEPFYFYFYLLPAAFAPWITILPWAVAAFWPGKAWKASEHRPTLYLAAWFISFFILFSLSQSKMLHYALPMLPPLALLLGHPLGKFFSMGPEAVMPAGLRRGTLALAWLMGLTALCMIFVPAFHNDITYRQAGIFVLLGPLLLVILGGAVYLMHHRWWGVVAAPLLVLTVSLGGVLLAVPAFEDYKSVKRIISIAQPQMRDTDILVNYGDHFYGTVYYTGRRMVIVNNWGEMDFGRRLDPQQVKWFLPGDGEFVELLLDRKQRVLVLSFENAYNRFRERTQGTPGLLLFEWARVGNKVLFSNRPR